MTLKKGGNGGEKGDEMDFHYLKMSSYHSYHVDGVFGGLAPNGNLYMELFIERLPTPQIVKHKITGGVLGDEISRTGKSGIIREIEAGLVLDMRIARTLRDWLDTRIKESDDRLKQIKEV